jgi:hypothetical protein
MLVLMFFGRWLEKTFLLILAEICLAQRQFLADVRCKFEGSLEMIRMIAIATAGLLVCHGAQAQMSNMMQGMMGGSSSSGSSGSGMMGGMGGMGSGMGLPSVGSASPNNLAGLLQFCVQNNYLGGTDASSVKSSLLSKFDGSSQPPEQNSGFSSGASGILDTGNGQTTTLGGTGIKAQVTKKVCDLVLKHAQSQL